MPGAGHRDDWRAERRLQGPGAAEWGYRAGTIHHTFVPTHRMCSTKGSLRGATAPGDGHGQCGSPGATRAPPGAGCGGESGAACVWRQRLRERSAFCSVLLYT